MLTVKNKKIYAENGSFLKIIDCPKKITVSDLQNKSDKKLLCKSCNQNILDTEYMSEKELCQILEKDKSTCLKISKLNPMFKFI
jgi:hypothetical protein